MKKLNKKVMAVLSIVVLFILIAVISVVLLNDQLKKNQTIETVTQNPEPQIITEANLQKIINVSELSTFEAVYNGIATVMNDEKPENVDYYVAYSSRVKAGINFEDVKIEVNTVNKIINVEIPDIQINDTEVDITSLDYIFENDKSNNETVSEQAYKKCIEDVQNAVNDEKTIYELAHQNAENIIEALIKPFVNKVDSEYQLIID